MTTERAATMSEDGEQSQVEHPTALPDNQSLRPVDAAIKLLLGPHRTKRDIVALFDGRAPYYQIGDWRYGKSKPPQWAVDMLREALTLRASPLLELRDRIAPGPGLGWNKGAKTLAAWRARKARGEV